MLICAHMGGLGSPKGLVAKQILKPGMYAFLFTILALFIIPKGFLMLDKLPSLNLGHLAGGRAQKAGLYNDKPCLACDIAVGVCCLLSLHQWLRRP